MNWQSLFGAIAQIVAVSRTLINESAIDPATKTDLHVQLDQAHQVVTTGAQTLAGDVGNIAKDLPAFGGGLAGSLAGGVAAMIPGVGAALAPEAEGLANSIVTGFLGNIEDIFVRHNKAHIAAIGQLLGSPPQAVANAQATVQAAAQPST